MSDTITAQAAVDVIEQMIARCDRRIASYAMKVAEDPKEAVSVGTDVSRYAFEKHIWEMALTVAKGERTYQSLEASLSARMLSLCGHGMGTADRLLTEKIELACIEDALDQTGALGVLKNIEGRAQPLSESVTLTDIGALLADRDRLAKFSAYVFPNLIGEDADDRRDDTKRVLEVFRDLVNGQVKI